MAEITHTDRLSRVLRRQRREAEQRRNASLAVLALLTLGMAALGVKMAAGLAPLQTASVVGLVFVAIVFLGCVLRAMLAEEAVLAIDRTIEAHAAELDDGVSFEVLADRLTQQSRVLYPRPRP